MSDRTQRFLLWALTVLLVAGTAIALHFARGYRPLVGLGMPSTSPLPPNIALRLDQVRVVGRSHNQPAWTLSADHIDTTRSRSRVVFTGNVRAILLQNGKPRASLDAPLAVYDSLTKKIDVSGAIICKVRDKKSGKETLDIRGNDLTWKVDSHLVQAAGPVHATFDDGATVQGDQLMVDLQTRDVHMKNTHAVFYVSEGDAAPPKLLQETPP